MKWKRLYILKFIRTYNWRKNMKRFKFMKNIVKKTTKIYDAKHKKMKNEIKIIKYLWKSEKKAIHDFLSKLCLSLIFRYIFPIFSQILFKRIKSSSLKLSSAFSKFTVNLKLKEVELNVEASWNFEHLNGISFRSILGYLFKLLKCWRKSLSCQVSTPMQLQVKPCTNQRNAALNSINNLLAQHEIICVNLRA